MSSPLVLVTGSAGRVGRAVVAELTARGLPVRGFDRVPTPSLPDSLVGSITEAADVQAAMQGVHTLIHLAATPDDDDFMTQLLPNNIVGVYLILEAARAAGVQRAILASSGQVVWNQRLTGPWPISVDAPVSPRYWYAAAKVFLEAAGRAFSDAHYIPSVIAVRLGWCPRTVGQQQEIHAAEWAQNVYLSPADAGRFFACAVQAPAELPWAVVYATSKPVDQELVDLKPARQLLGYVPRDTWPQGL
ncbi:MAG: NAD(P)-dependent oxidoreductase [Planctomycetia bacterium]|nr:NAD(P)-dependent oxidoreductase [Planctomycetia bacterium]